MEKYGDKKFPSIEENGLILKKLAPGIERIRRVLSKLEEKVVYARKIFAPTLFHLLAEKNHSQCSQGA